MDFLPFYVLFVINLVILFMWHEERKQSSQERKDLYDRLMAKSFDQYKDRTTAEPNQLEPTQDPQDDNVIDIEDARADLEAHG